jgi:hypothetical protein
VEDVHIAVKQNPYQTESTREGYASRFPLTISRTFNLDFPLDHFFFDFFEEPVAAFAFASFDF